MEVICKKAQQELKLITQRNDELSKKVQELQDDVRADGQAVQAQSKKINKNTS